MPLVIVLLVAVPFVLPLVSFFMNVGLRRRLQVAEERLDQQRQEIEELTKLVRAGRWASATGAAATTAKYAAPVTPVPDAPASAITQAASEPVQIPPRVVTSTPANPPPPPPASTPLPVTPPATPAPNPTERAAAAVPHPPAAAKTSPPIAAVPRRPPPPPSPPPPLSPPTPAFDWESLIGVKMFSAVAGVALVLAAVFFLKYSMDQGWLAPPIRVAIGIVTAVALLIVCDLKAARRYRTTANAMDAAAIAILFATFFAAHALWNLIPASVAFILLALVTAVAVLLSIRRDSLFIAVLGLLGGFATPILLSTGEDQPVPLFAYLLLLNIGLAWVASRKRWSVLTILTLIFTAMYQWGWVFRFLQSSHAVPLAMAIFLLFAIAGFVSMLFSARAADEEEGTILNRIGLIAAAMPLLFAALLAAVPGYGARPSLLFGFLLIVDAGLLAVAIARGEEIAHALGALSTMVVVAAWLTMSYASDAFTTILIFTPLFVAFFTAAPVVASRFSRPFEGMAKEAESAAPLLLFVFAVLARIEPAAESPFKLFVVLFALLVMVAWRALATGEFSHYFIAAFLAVATEASWSATHLTADHLREALVWYAAFAVFYLGVPMLARRNREITPAWGGGAVMIAGLLLLLFLSVGPRTTASLWGLALLLAILNAGLFIESAASRLPALSLVGSVLSWLVLAAWWQNAAAVVGLLPALSFLVGLTFVMLAGHSWTARARHVDATRRFGDGTFLGLAVYLFLFAIALNPEWSTPPWPLFGALTVVMLAFSAASLASRADTLHAASVFATALVISRWAQASAIDWSPTMVAAGESVVAYALVWIALTRSRNSALTVSNVLPYAAIGATSALVIAEFTLIRASAPETLVPTGVIAATHALNLALILALAWVYQWRWVAPLAAVPAALALVVWAPQHPAREAWTDLMLLASTIYVVFVGYPFVLGDRTRGSRDPFLAAIAGSALLFFAARVALRQGELLQFAGAVPIVEAGVMALLLRRLLRLEPSGERDLGRLALVAATALAFVTVAIPLQLSHQWITIGWALEGAALAWTYRRIPHRGLLLWGAALLAVVFARLALNPAIFFYEPRGYRLFNWYLYAYGVCSVALFVAASWYTKTDDRLIPALPRVSALLPAGGAILLFLLLNIEIADYYATGPEITFRFGVTLAQDLTYTIGWLIFGLVMLGVGIYRENRAARIAAVALIAVTAFKAFLYDMRSLGGLYRVVSLVGLAFSLALVALALQRFVLRDRNR